MANDFLGNMSDPSGSLDHCIVSLFTTLGVAETLVNLQLGVRSQGDRWDAQVWARNLFDNHVETLIFDSVFQAGSFSTFFAPPRTYGLTVSTNF
jgi:outer membrane receptor protein involved in Fe transport